MAAICSLAFPGRTGAHQGLAPLQGMAYCCGRTPVGRRPAARGCAI